MQEFLESMVCQKGEPTINASDLAAHRDMKGSDQNPELQWYEYFANLK